MNINPAALKATVIELSPRKRQRADYAVLSADRKSLLFAFPSKAFPLTPADRFVASIMNLNQMIVQARSDLRQMTIDNALAV